MTFLLTLFRITRFSFAYLCYLVAQIVFSVLVLPALMLFLPFPRARRAIVLAIFNGSIYLLTRIYLPLLGIYSIRRIVGFDHEKKPEKTIFIANHRSRIDGPLVLSVIKHAGVLMKSEYSRAPFFASFINFLDFISVNPHSLDTLNTAMKKARSLIDAGKNMLIFPEGSRSSSARLQPFRDLAFRIAAETGARIIPVIVHTDLPFMAKIPKSTFPARRMNVQLHFLDPVVAQEGERPSDTAARTRRLMTEKLRELDESTIWEKYYTTTGNHPLFGKDQQS